MRTAKTLIRLGGCPGWSESSLGAHTFCLFCHVALIWCMYIIAFWQSFAFKCRPNKAFCSLCEPRHDKTNKMACAPSEDSDQPGHPACLIRVYAVRMKKAWVLRYPLSAQRRLWSDWADGQADLSLRWAHSHNVGFLMSRLISSLYFKCVWCMYIIAFWQSFAFKCKPCKAFIFFMYLCVISFSSVTVHLFLTLWICEQICGKHIVQCLKHILFIYLFNLFPLSRFFFFFFFFF